jgi:hypothetical protein
MRILVAISILVLLVLLWATVSIIQHIRKSRRRSRFLREDTPQLEAAHVLSPSPEPTFAELAAKTLTVSLPTASPAIAPPHAGVSSARRMAVSQTPSAGALGLIAQARKLSQDMPQPQIRPSGVHKAVVATPEPQPVLTIVEVPQLPAAPPPIEILAEIPVIPSQPVPVQVVTQPLAASVADVLEISPAPRTPAFASIPFFRRPIRPAPAFTLPAHRPDWVYFNKDMGDLSDPTPSRIRDRIRSR